MKEAANESVIEYTNWLNGHGSGNDNHAYLLTGKKLGYWGSIYSDVQSPRTFCVMCEFRKQDIQYHLKGLCEESRHDRVFYLHQEGTERPIFKGDSSSIIIWVTNISSDILDIFKSPLLCFRAMNPNRGNYNI